MQPGCLVLVRKAVTQKIKPRQFALTLFLYIVWAIILCLLIKAPSIRLPAEALPTAHRCSCATSDNTLFSAVSTPPFPLLKIKEALYKVRGDLYAGAMKLHEDSLSIKGELELLVDEKDGEEIWNLTEGDSVEVGPFRVRSHLCHCHHSAVCALLLFVLVKCTCMLLPEVKLCLMNCMHMTLYCAVL